MTGTGIGAAMAGGNPRDGREDNELYETPEDVTQALLEFWRPKSRKVHEPACASGKMVRVIERYGYDVIATDLLDQGCGMGGIDFLKTTERAADCLITNPPFNVPRGISERFIRHAFHLGYSEVAMLLSSNYWHARTRLALFEDHTPSYVLPLSWRPDFKEKGRPTMNLVWTVWSEEMGSSASFRPLPRPCRILAEV